MTPYGNSTPNRSKISPDFKPFLEESEDEADEEAFEIEKFQANFQKDTINSWKSRAIARSKQPI